MQALTAAIVGGAVAAVFGGTRWGLSGPALSMTILVASCVVTHGLPSLFVIGFVCGVSANIISAFIY
jgi:SulP family sulfate permease